MAQGLLVEKTITEFLNELASDSPAPGGGSMAALSAASAAGLGSMVARLTAASKKEEYQSVRGRMIELVDELEHHRRVFMRIIDEDTAAFNDIMAAFRLPKDTDEAKNFRTKKIQEAYRKATLVPYETAKLTLVIMKLLGELSEHGMNTAISDVGVGFHLAFAALEGGRLNVLINLSSIKDEEFRRYHFEEIERIHVTAIELVKRGIVTVEKKL